MRTLNIVKTISVAVFWVVMASCHKTENAIILSDYPNKIGDQWVYFVQDSLAHVNDTLTVTIVSAASLNGSASLLWQYSYSNGLIDTLQAVTYGDTIDYYTNPPFPTLSFGLLFPIASGLSWKDNMGYKNAVTYISSYSSLGQNYASLYEISHTDLSGGFALTDNIYIESKIGIVYRKILEYNMGPEVNQTWTLINYHLN